MPLRLYVGYEMTDKKTEALKLALEALVYLKMQISDGWDAGSQKKMQDKAITALREALAEQPASKPFVGLTDEERNWLRKRNQKHDDYAKAVEALLKEKNT